jgi:hypothetical protein
LLTIVQQNSTRLLTGGYQRASRPADGGRLGRVVGGGERRGIFGASSRAGMGNVAQAPVDPPGKIAA